MTDEEFEKLENCEKLRYRICKLDLSEYTIDKLTFSLTDIEEEIYRYKEVLDKIKEVINHYAVEDEDYSKIYNQEEKDILELLEEIE